MVEVQSRSAEGNFEVLIEASVVVVALRTPTASSAAPAVVVWEQYFVMFAAG